MPRSMMSAPGIARRRLRAIDLLEDVGRQTPNAVKFFHDPGSWGLRGRCSAQQAGAIALSSVCGGRRGLASLRGAIARRNQVVLELFLLRIREHGASRAAAACRALPDRRTALPDVAGALGQAAERRRAYGRPMLPAEQPARSGGCDHERRRREAGSRRIRWCARDIDIMPRSTSAGYDAPAPPGPPAPRRNCCQFKQLRASS